MLHTSVNSSLKDLQKKSLEMLNPLIPPDKAELQSDFEYFVKTFTRF